MSKLQINNEIVAMRQAVRQARVHTARKLIREAKTLRSKRGDEKQQLKYKRKADRHTQEVLAMKKLSDDEIAKFAVTNWRSLQEVLADANADAETRVLARLSFHKSVLPRIAGIKEKYPNYKEQLGPGKRKLMKLKRKAGKRAKKDARQMEIVQKSDIQNSADKIEKSDSDEFEEEGSDHENADKVDSDDESIADRSELEEDNNSEEESQENHAASTNSEEKSEANESVDEKRSSEPGSLLRIKLPSEKSHEIKPARKKSDKSEAKSAPVPVTVVSREATVKRFAELLKEEQPEKERSEISDTESQKTKLEAEREADTFFITGDGEEEYLKVLVPKSTMLEEDEEEISYAPESFRNAREENFRKHRNERFFTKMDKFNGKNGEKRKDSSSRDSDRRKRPRKEFERKENAGEQKMHPSWEARRKQQEILKQGFQGKKIVFDD